MCSNGLSMKVTAAAAELYGLSHETMRCHSKEQSSNGFYLYWQKDVYVRSLSHSPRLTPALDNSSINMSICLELGTDIVLLQTIPSSYIFISHLHYIRGGCELRVWDENNVPNLRFVDLF